MQKKTIANQAFEKYDQQGEAAMLTFIAENIKKPQATVNPDWNNKVFLFQDNSTIQQTPNSTYQAKPPPDQYLLETQERPLTLSPAACPTIIPYIVPMLPWPNSETLRLRVTEKIFDRAIELTTPSNTSYEDLPEHLVFELAPDLVQNIINTTMNYDLPNYLRENIDSIMDDLAHDLLRQLPPNQRHALLEAAQTVLRNQEQEEKS